MCAKMRGDYSAMVDDRAKQVAYNFKRILIINSVRDVSAAWPGPIPLGFVWAGDVFVWAGDVSSSVYGVVLICEGIILPIAPGCTLPSFWLKS